jgi:hypothetical protein
LRLVLVLEPTASALPWTARTKRFLKLLLRNMGFRCVRLKTNLPEGETLDTINV